MSAKDVTPKPDWLNNDPLFHSELRKGHKFETYVAQQLMLEGFVIQLPLKEVRENVTHRSEFYNEVDIWIGSWNHPPIKLEVKSRNLRFTTPQNFPYDPIFVTTIDSWKKADTKPSAILTVSQHAPHTIIATSAAHRKQWVETETFDTVRNIWVDNYAARKGLWKPFEEFCEALKKKFGMLGEEN